MQKDFPLLVPVSSQGEWAITRFYGDPERAAAYLPVAYALLGVVKQRMAMGGVGYGAQTAQLPDGTRIRVLRNMNQNIVGITVPPGGPKGSDVQIVTLFIEHGYTFIRPIVWGDFAKDAGTLYWSDRLKDDHPSSVKKLRKVTFFDWLQVNITERILRSVPETRKYEPGMPSLAFPEYLGPEETAEKLRELDEKIKQATERDEQMELASEYRKIERGRDRRQLIGVLIAAARWSPGMAMGKAKLLVQVILGSVLPLTDELLFRFGFAGTLSSSAGLLTTVDYKYYAISISTSRITAQRVKLTLAGEVLLSLLKRQTLSTRDKDALETYALLGAKLADQSFTVPCTPEIDVAGGSFAYGWHPSWDGKEWTVCTNEPNYSGIRIVSYTARRYSITIEENKGFDIEKPIADNNSPLTAKFDQAESEVWCLRLQKDHIWFPEYYVDGVYGMDGRQQVFIPYSPLQKIAPMACDAPIYSFFQRDPDSGESALLVFRYVDSGEDKVPPPSEATIRSHVFSYDCGAYRWTTIDQTTGWMVTKNGDPVGRYTYNENVTSEQANCIESAGGGGSYVTSGYAGAGVWKNVAGCGGLVTFPPSEWLQEEPDGNYWTRHYITFITENLRWIHGRATSSNTRNGILLIPFFQQDAAYVLNRITNDYSNNTAGMVRQVAISVTGAPYGLSTSVCHDNINGPSYSSAAGQWDADIYPVEGVGSIRNIYTSTVMDFYYPAGVERVDFVETIYDEPSDDVRRCGCAEVSPEDPPDMGEKVWRTMDNQKSIKYPAGRWDLLFSPVLFGSLAYPYYDNPFLAHSGVTEAAYFDGDVNIDAEDDLPQVQSAGGLPDYNEDGEPIGLNGVMTGRI